MRRRTLNLTVPFVILTLTLSFVAILPVTGQGTSTITSKLEELRRMLDNEQPSLKNKVNAVIHQIEAGAFNGALNKLQNDVKKSIEAKVEDPEQAIELVNEIIKDIEDLLHPKPPRPDFEIYADPTSLEVVQGDSNTTIITIMSLNNFTQEVELVNSTTATSVTLSLDPSSVTPPPNGTVASTLNAVAALDAALGDYIITVTATSTCFEPKMAIIELKIIPQTPEPDKTPPTITSVLRAPETPAYNQSVIVDASVFDEGGSGLKQVILNYSGGLAWTPVVMTASEGLFTATIPTFPYDTTIEYRVFASDNNNNVANSILYSYKVTDPYPPLLRIDAPTQGSYLSGTITVTVFMKDQNTGGESGFGSAELSINNTVVKVWLPPAPSAPDTYSWNTVTFGADGLYILNLTVIDEAGNIAEKSLTVTVDNTLPTAMIEQPAAGSYQRLTTSIKMTGSDANFDKMELRIDNELVTTYLESGTKEVEWDTQSEVDGDHNITLTVYDKAGNLREALINVTVDNTPPSIGTPTWSPEEPAANVDIQINVTVSEPPSGSGVDRVSLWFKNTTMNEWQSTAMELVDGNWTVVMKDQSDTIVRFYIEAFDKAGNRAETTERPEFPVAAPTGFPLFWILAAIAIILVALVAVIYVLDRRQKKGTTTPSVSAPPKTT